MADCVAIAKPSPLPEPQMLNFPFHLRQNLSNALARRSDVSPGPRSRAIHEHAESGERSQGPTVFFAAEAVSAVLSLEASRRKFVYRGKSLQKWAASVLLALVIVGGIASTAFVSQASYSGAKSVSESRIAEK